ncbi:15624_t:CDS:2 [Funneliformis geosporum]|uniref:15624_t:CDS:1 n=1 Tax=Funneliformis geosporum TaxID=1117311 RepID=A0A9W4S9L3_9GLOM|nr:15624_t:CDS:2 [Funneliformis geosporum]
MIRVKINVLYIFIRESKSIYVDEPYDFDLITNIVEGLREKLIPGTPEDYVKVYTKCWDFEPDKRPTMKQLVDELKRIKTKIEDSITVDDPVGNYGSSPNSNNTIDSSINNSFPLIYVGKCYEDGYGINEDKTAAFEYYEKAANKNFTVGQSKIGYFYYNGIGVVKDLKNAVDWYEKASNLGNIIAKYYLGNLYLNGIGVKRDRHKAFELFAESAEGNYSNGITILGYCYKNGKGTSINKKKAFELYVKASELNNKVAQYNLALMYEYGDGVKKDKIRANELYKESAKQGYPKDVMFVFLEVSKI